MAIPVARVHLAMAHAALPALLPTPPKSKMLLPTPPCILTLPMSPPNKPSRADEKSDARKNATKSPSNPCRADAVERWDARKALKPASPAASSCEKWDSNKRRPAGTGSRGSSGQRTPYGKRTNRPGRASSCERWDSNKKSATTSSSSKSGGGGIISASRASSGEKWDSNKRRPAGTGSRASSAERWDAHKKPRPQRQAGGVDDEDGQSSNDMEFYAGPGFLASPEPSMLPMPSSLLMLRASA